MTIALSPRVVREFTISGDSTVWLIAPLTHAEVLGMQSGSGFDLGAYIVKCGLRGWRNFRDVDGVDAVFEGDFIERISVPTIGALASEIGRLSGLAVEEKKE